MSDLIAGSKVAGIAGTAPNHFVTKAQLDLKANLANGMPCDFLWVAQSPLVPRASGVGDFTNGFVVYRAFSLTKVIYEFETVSGGSDAVELRKNTVQVSSSNLTVSVANQAPGSGTVANRTGTIAVSYAVNDRLDVACTPGTTPGRGLRAYLFGTWD